jgi:hypothetical protein
MKSKIITLSVENDLTNAYLTKGILDEHGIDCFVSNENITTANPLYMNAVGGIEVQIKEEDKENAIKILAQHRGEEKSNEHFEKPVTEKIASEILCPQCGSDEVRKEKVSAAAFAVSLLLLGFPLPFFKRKHHCFDCQHEWK